MLFTDQDYTRLIHIRNRVYKLDEHFYFADEAELIDGNGPFNTVEEADKACTNYFKCL